MTTDELNVNLIELTPKYRIGKVEHKILLLVARGYQEKDDDYSERFPLEGCNMAFLIKKLYPTDGVDYGDAEAMNPKPKAMVSRALHALYRKGLLKVAIHPVQGHKMWHPVGISGAGTGYYGGMQYPDNDNVSVLIREHHNTNTKAKLQSHTRYCYLPKHVRKWWMLTDAGKVLVDSWKVPNKTPQAGSSKDGR